MHHDCRHTQKPILKELDSQPVNEKGILEEDGDAKEEGDAGRSYCTQDFLLGALVRSN